MNRLLTALPLLLLTACEKPQPANPAEPAAAASPALTDWPITRGSPSLQGRIAAAVPKAPVIEWTFPLESPGTAEAAAADGVILVGDAMGILYCIDLESRKLRWKMETGDTIQAAPAISNGKVFVGSGDKHFYALDLKSGDKLWSIEGGDKFSSAPTIVTSPDGKTEWLLVNGYDGTTRCLLAETGAIVWTYETDDYINGTPAVIDGRFVAFGGCDTAIHIINLADGKPVNKVATESPITNSVATSGTTIYCGNHANQVIAAEAEGKEPTWIYEGGDFPFFSAPAVDDQHVYIGSRDKSLHAVKRSDGTGAWKFKTGGRVESSPIAFDDGIVFGSSDGRLYAANPADGTELWRLDLGEDLTASPVYAQGRIIIAGGDGTLFVINSSKD
ncbi:MAG: Serine/threonine-protein kinase AfsK [Verrucomicrobiota bacterium]|jgi:outer membrane protein assembly factor BamB